MVSTTIHFKSLGITSQLVLLRAQYLEFTNRRLDGSLRMEVLTVLPSLLRAVSPCKDFLRFTTHHLGIFTLFVEFSTRL
jgi:hypothetical protein